MKDSGIYYQRIPMKKAEKDEIWQIITHLVEQGLKVKEYTVSDHTLVVTLHIPLLIGKSLNQTSEK